MESLFNQPIVDKSFELYLNCVTIAVFSIGIIAVVSLILDDLCSIHNIWKTRIMVAVIIYGLGWYLKIGSMLQ